MRDSRIAFRFRPVEGGRTTEPSIGFGADTIRLPVEIRLHEAPRPAETSKGPPARLPSAKPSVMPGAGRNHPDRDNNPLDMRSGATTRRFGSTTDDGGFAVFDSAQTGFAAAASRFDRIGGTLDHIVSVWSPAADNNDTAGMQKQIAAAAGLSGSQYWHDLSDAQKRAFLQAYARREGYHGGGPQAG
ncbi:hypothetical protein FHR90_002688 [Endobacter medicaginis]|uniref:Uncharacterized protein n=1 Tax=Endobacter medicaginis TaxID=1181271 RepID=A0A839V5X1_9PROT|nr:hypothetical protein [Endobacter medicaginis]MBB3174841.1 hypothetical protein [Endobacter medicaginis]MCX5475627.1 hypothetical protein [Endobacter medicaginis]NVN29113.1 hypothetical protein [Endobacter medicaginis]